MTSTSSKDVMRKSTISCSEDVMRRRTTISLAISNPLHVGSFNYFIPLLGTIMYVSKVINIHMSCLINDLYGIEELIGEC